MSHFLQNLFDTMDFIGVGLLDGLRRHLQSGELSSGGHFQVCFLKGLLTIVLRRRFQLRGLARSLVLTVHGPDISRGLLLHRNTF